MNKTIVLLILMANVASVFSMNFDVEVLYDKDVENFPLEELKNIRLKDADEQKDFFEAIYNSFSLEKAWENISSFSKDEQKNIIIWFTNYNGIVPKKTYTWYNENLFSKVELATFWLTDLKAWRFLSTSKSQLEKQAKLMVNKINEKQVELDECPLISKSDQLSDTINEYFKTLRSSDFFNWLKITELPHRSN